MRGTYLLLADMTLSACSAARHGGVCSSPAPLVLNSASAGLPFMVCSVIPHHSLSAMSCEKENSVRYWVTGMDEIWLSIPSKPFHFTFPKGKMLPKSICILKRFPSSHNSIFQWEKLLISSRSLAQLTLDVYSLLCAPTGRANIQLMFLPRTEDSQISLQWRFLINIMSSTR